MLAAIWTSDASVASVQVTGLGTGHDVTDPG